MGFWPALGLMVVSFAILAKCADWLVEGAIGISQRLHMPPILIGIVVVSLAAIRRESRLGAADVSSPVYKTEFACLQNRVRLFTKQSSP